MMTLHFLRPAFFLLLIPLFLLFFLAFFARKRSNWENVCDKNLLPHLLKTSRIKNKFRGQFLSGVAWLSVVIALAGPTWQSKDNPIFQKKHFQVYVLDVSDAMSQTDLSPDRLTRAKYKLQDALELQKETRSGLVVFTGQAFTVSPLTDDPETIRLFIPDLSASVMPIGGVSIAAGLKRAQALLIQAGATQGDVILLTASSVTAADEKAAEELLEKGFHLQILGIAKNNFDDSNLKQLAQTGGGAYQLFQNNDDDLNALFQKSATPTLTQITQKKRAIDDGLYFIWPALFIFLLLFRRGALGVMTP